MSGNWIETDYESGGRRFEYFRARQLLSTDLAFSFCRPFCKICFQDVLELSDAAIGHLARAREVLVQDLLRTAQRVSVMETISPRLQPAWKSIVTVVPRMS